MTPAMYWHFLVQSVRLKSDRNHRVPLTVNVRLTHRCSNRCVYCDYDRGRPDALTLPVLGSAFDDIWRLGGRRLNFTGGEPLLRNDFDSIVALAKRRGFFVSLATSGSMAKERLDGLKLCDRIMLSFDGPAEVRTALCGPNASEDSENAIRLFDENRIRFWTTTVITKANIGHIDWIVDHARAHKSQANFVLMYTGEPNGFRTHPVAGPDVSRLVPSVDENRKVLSMLIAMKRAGAPIGSSLPYLEECLEWQDYPACRADRRSRRYGSCLALRSSCELMADGSLYSCDWAFARNPAISILDRGFAAAYMDLPLLTECHSCILSCKLETNLLFHLDPVSVWNWLSRTWRP